MKVTDSQIGLCKATIALNIDYTNLANPTPTRWELQRCCNTARHERSSSCSQPQRLQIEYA